MHPLDAGIVLTAVRAMCPLVLYGGDRWDREGFPAHSGWRSTSGVPGPVMLGPVMLGPVMRGPIPEDAGCRVIQGCPILTWSGLGLGFGLR